MSDLEPTKGKDMSNTRHAKSPWLSTGEARYRPLEAAMERDAEAPPPDHGQTRRRPRRTSTFQHAVQVVRKMLPGTATEADVTIDHKGFYTRLDNDARLYTYETQRGVGSRLTARQARRIRKRDNRVG